MQPLGPSLFLALILAPLPIPQGARHHGHGGRALGHEATSNTAAANVVAPIAIAAAQAAGVSAPSSSGNPALDPGQAMRAFSRFDMGVGTSVSRNTT